MFESNRALNFDIQLTPEQVAEYLLTKTLFLRLNSTEPSEIEAALFVTNDGECGFIANKTWSPGTYKYLVSELNSFVIHLPQDLRTKLWCRVQPDNTITQRLVQRLGFKEADRSDKAIYYLYGGTT